MSDLARVLVGKNYIVLDANFESQEVKVLYGYSALHGVIGIYNEKPLDTFSIGDDEKIIQITLTFGVDWVMICQFLSEEGMRDLEESGRFETIRSLTKNISSQEQYNIIQDKLLAQA